MKPILFFFALLACLSLTLCSLASQEKKSEPHCKVVGVELMTHFSAAAMCNYANFDYLTVSNPSINPVDLNSLVDVGEISLREPAKTNWGNKSGIDISTIYLQNNEFGEYRSSLNNKDNRPTDLENRHGLSCGGAELLYSQDQMR